MTHEKEPKNTHYTERYYYDNQQKVEGIPINPLQRYNFDMTPHGKRPQKEIDDWWEQPYIITKKSEKGEITYTVRCLDGGAWDRSTRKDAFNNINDALALAKSLKD